jgi:cytochrome c551/c552
MKKVFLYLVFVLNLFGGDGALLFHGNCVTCHNKTKAISAPSMSEIRQRYLIAFTKKEDFVKYMTNFVIKPDKDISIMRDKIQKYKLMPLLGYEKSVINDIASYIYKTDF